MHVRPGSLTAVTIWLLAMTAGSVAAQDFDREVAFLTIPTGARLVGMGRAGAAMAGEFQAVRWNPAALGSLDGVAPLVSLYEGPLDFRVSQFAVAVPAGDIGAFAVSVEIQDFGEIVLSGPSPGVPQGTITPGNLIVGLGYSHLFFQRLSLGVTGKWISSDLVGNLSGSTVALDMGLLARPLDAVPFRIGVSALNLGPGLQLGEARAADPLPSRLRLGLSYDALGHIRGTDDLQLLFALDLEHAWRDLGTGSQFVGVEFGVRKVVYVRGGFISETLIETNTGTTLGFGLVLGVFKVDLAFEQGVNQLGDETHVSLGAVF